MHDRFCARGSLSLALTIALGGCVPQADEVITPTDNTKDSIVGGNNTTIANHPWQISLQTNSGFHFCGGSILTDTWIITAAHCVQGSSASSMRVVAGITRVSQSSTGQIRSVAQIIVNPGFTSPENGHDAALLRLTTPLDLSGTNARPIAIATPADRTAGLTNAGVNSVVTGWGSLSSGGSSPDILQEVTIPIVSNADASAAYGQTITDDQIAAGLLNVGGRDSCQGDSGGPLTVPNGSGGRILAGLVSWGNGCADPDFPGLYARVSSFATWIQSNVTVNVVPSVSITSPANGATVSGSINVTASASDSDGTVARVRFFLPNGVTVDDTSSPYSTSFDTTTVGDGQVQIRATSIDNLGANSPQATVTVVASNGNTCTSGTFAATGLPISIPDNNTTGIASDIDISGPGTVTSLSLSLSIDHTWRGDLRVVLSSPSGTTFVVHDRTGGQADDLVISNQAITTFAGQTIDGVWTLAVQDTAGQDVGTLDAWSLSIVGNCGGGGGGNWSGSRTPNLATVDNGSVCDSVTVAQTGQASQARLNISGTHAFRSILRGTLAHNGVTVTAFPINTFARGSGTFSFTNRAIAGLSGDAAGTWTLCIIDTDAFNDTGVLNSWSVHN